MNNHGAPGSASANSRLRLILLAALYIGLSAPSTTAAPPQSGAAPDHAAANAAPAPISRPIEPPVTQPAPASLPASQPSTMPAGQPASAPSTQARDPDLTVEMIETYKKRVQGSADLPDAEKKTILEMYDKALAQLHLAEQWQTQIARYDEAIRQIPAQLEAARAKWAAPVENLEPQEPAGATLQQIEELCARAEERDREARLEASALQREQQASQNRRQENQARIAAIRQTQAQWAEELDKTSGKTEIDQARRVLLRAQRRALWRELAALNRQSAYDDARRELLTVQIDLANRYQQETSRALALWKAKLKERTAAEAARVADQAGRQSVAYKDRPELFQIAEQNAQLARKRIELQTLAGQIEAMPSVDDLRQQRRVVNDNYDSMKKRIQAAGLTEAISSLLRRHRAQLPDVLQHQRNYRRLEAEYAKAQIELIDLEDQRAALVDIDHAAAQMMRTMDRSLSAQDKPTVRAQLQDLLRAKRKYLDDLIRDYDARAREWSALQEEERQLIAATTQYADFIDEHILWVRSTRPLQPLHLQNAWHAVGWLADPDNWKHTGRACLASVRAGPVATLLGLGTLLLLVAIRPHLRRRLRAIDQMASKGYSYAFAQTLEAMALTLLLALAGPGFLWFAGWRLSAAVTTSELAAALAAGLRSAGLLFLVLEVVRHVCRNRGLGQTHLRWPGPAMQLLRRNLGWLTPLVVPLVLIVAMMEWQASGDYKDSLGRLLFVAVMVALTFFARRVLQPAGPLMANVLQRNVNGWLDRLRYVWYPAIVAVPAEIGRASCRERV